MASDSKWFQNGNTTPVRFNLETDTYDNQDECNCGEALDGRRFYGYSPSDKLMRNFCFACYSTLETVPSFTFGKYKGKTYEEILSIDPGYFRWLWNKSTDTEKPFKVDQTILDFINENRQAVDDGWYQIFTMPFGKHKGALMTSVDKGYLRWLSGTEIKHNELAEWIGLWRLKCAEEEQSSDSDSEDE